MFQIVQSEIVIIFLQNLFVRSPLYAVKPWNIVTLHFRNLCSSLSESSGHSCEENWYFLRRTIQTRPGMNRKQLTDPQDPYRMNYYPTAIAPAGYAVAATDKPGLYAASPYAAIPSPYATAQAGLPPSMQHYAAAQQQYAMVSQASPYTQHATAYYATPSAAGYAATAGVPLSSLQTIPSSTPQSAYLSAQYPAAVGVQRAMLGPTPVTAAGYGGSPLYAASTYTGLPGVPGQTSRPTFGMAPVGYATAASLPPSVTSPAYPGATNFGPPY